jgi:hypothetical protein
MDDTEITGPEGDEAEKGPFRTCLATRAVLPVERMVRFVVGPGDAVVPDIRARLPGRGAWVTADRAAIADAARRKLFARAFRTAVVVPPTLVADVERLLLLDARQALAMANKAGLVVQGFAKVEAAIAGRKAVALVTARDGAADGRRKLIAAILRTHGRPDGIPTIDQLAGDEMSLALGRENAIHAALLAGAAGDAFVTRVRRLESFRSETPSAQGPDAGETPASRGPLAPL